MEEAQHLLLALEQRLSWTGLEIAQLEETFEHLDQSVATRFQVSKQSLAYHKERHKEAIRTHRSSQLKNIALDEASNTVFNRVLHRTERTLSIDTISQSSSSIIINLEKVLSSIDFSLCDKEPQQAILLIPNPFHLPTTPGHEHEHEQAVVRVGFRPINRDISTINTLIRSVGQSGSNSPLHFKSPDGIAVHPLTERVYIVDQKNSRIQVLNSDLSFHEVYESINTMHGSFSEPRGININIFGTIALVDCNNSRILFFSTQWMLLNQVKGRGSAPNEFCHPRHVTSDQQGCFYVSDRDNYRVQKFSPKGDFIHQFRLGLPESTQQSRLQPYGLAVNDANEVVIAPMSGSQMYVHHVNGDFIRCVPTHHLSGNANFVSRGPGGGVLLTDFGAGSVSIFSKEWELQEKIESFGAISAVFIRSEDLILINNTENEIYVY